MVTIRYLLDSNVLSEPVRPTPSPSVVRRLERDGPLLATSATVFHEMLFGMEKLPPSRKREAIAAHLETVVASMPILPYDEEAARWHATERARLERVGLPASYRDSQIAAVAAIHGLILVTANVSDFAQLSGLTIENWREP